MRMIIKEIDISGEKFRLMLTEQIISQVNNLKTLYSAAYVFYFLPSYTFPVVFNTGLCQQ